MQQAFPAGDVDYHAVAALYAKTRRADPRIAAQILDALGDANSVLNVGAGTGNYEPTDRLVVGLEPSAAMRAHRPPNAAPCVVGAAEALPFDDGAFDAVMSVLSCHQWRDKPRGLAELLRVARRRVVLVTFDPAAFGAYWLNAYIADISAAEAARFLPMDTMMRLLGGAVTVRPCLIPQQCSDGFMEAYFGRPEAFLDPAVRASQSGWAFAPEGAEQRGIAHLGADLASGVWDARYGHLRTAASFVGSLRILIADVGR